MATIPKFVGARVRRREDPRLITGRATYVDDVRLPGTLHLAFLRSPYAHARIVRIDSSRARTAPGVVAVVTGAEVKDLAGPLPVASTQPGMRMVRRYPLAIDRVRHVGEPVAVVAATSREAARDALDLITVEYEPLPAVVEVEQALAPGAPRVHEEFPDNQAFVITHDGGDVERAFREADRVIALRLENQRVIPLPMEPRAVLAHRQGDLLTVWLSTQIPHGARSYYAEIFGLPENQIRVIAPEVGGGFGAKADIYAEEVMTVALALKLGRPVKWTADRREEFVGMSHGRGQVDFVEAAVKNDGTVLGLRLRVLSDLGAYYQLFTAGIAPLTGLMAVGPYKIPNVHYEIVGVFTNKTPTDAYRGAGRPEATYLLERLMDVIARDLGLDPAEVRRRNLLEPHQFPYTTPTGAEYDSGNYRPTLERALAIVNYRQFREEQARLRAQGRYLGLGLSFYVEICGMGPSKAMGGQGWEQATVVVEETGKVTVLAGISPHGQGQETTFAQIVADELGVTPEDVVVLHGDTAIVPKGVGTFGSRGLAVGGTALVMSLNKVKEKARQIAAHLLEAAVEDVVWENGRFVVRGVPGRGVTIQEIAAEAYDARRLPPGMEPGLTASSFFEPPNFTYPHGCHVAIVEVDPETGRVVLRRYVAVDDCGRVISPLLVEGQLHGGIAQGVAQALCEGVHYDESGQLITGSLMDYAVPTAHDLPAFELDRTETPTPVNPLGAKGVGEAGTIGSTPAVVNAVIDALAPFGVRHIDMPLWPEKIWRAIQSR